MDRGRRAPDPQLWLSWVNCRPLPHSGGGITGFPFSLFFLTPCPSRPRSSLKLHRTERRCHRSPELGQSRMDPGGREFPTGRGPAVLCRRHLTADGMLRDGRWAGCKSAHTAFPEVCLPKGSPPAPKRPFPAVFLPETRKCRRRGGSGPFLDICAAPRRIRGATPRANQEHRGDNAITPQDESCRAFY